MGCGGSRADDEEPTDDTSVQVQVPTGGEWQGLHAAPAATPTPPAPDDSALQQRAALEAAARSGSARAKAKLAELERSPDVHETPAMSEEWAQLKISIVGTAAVLKVNVVKRHGRRQETSDDASAVPQAAGLKYMEPEAIFAAVDAGDVQLLSGRWLLERAGYVVGTDGHITLPGADHLSQPLPNRQQIESSEEGGRAVISSDKLRSLHASLKARAARARNRR